MSSENNDSQSLAINEYDTQTHPPSISIHVSAGHGKLVIQIQEIADKIELSISEILPHLFQIGTNLNEANCLQSIHDQLLKKFEAKTHEIITRCTRDGVDLIFIENSLQKILIELKQRKNILEQSVKFFKNLTKFSAKTPNPIQDDISIENPREHLLELYEITFESGKELLKLINELSKNTKQSPNESVSFIQKQLKSLSKMKYDFISKQQENQARDDTCAKAKYLTDCIKNTQNLIINKAEYYFENSKLGSDLQESLALQNEHTEIEKHFHQLFHDIVLKYVDEADQMISNDVQQMAQELLQTFEKYSLKLENRRKLLTILVSFYKKTSSSNEELEEKYSISKIYSSDDSKATIRFSELSQSVNQTKEIMNSQIQEKSSNFDAAYYEVLTWIATTGESFLEQHRDFGVHITYISDYVDNHQQMLFDLNEIDKKIVKLRDMLDCDQVKYQIIRDRFQMLKKAVETRIHLSFMHLEFVKNVHKQQNLASDIQELLKLQQSTSKKTHFDCYFDEKIKSFESCSHELSKNGRLLISDLKLVNANEVRLNINHALSNIELMLNDSCALFENAKSIIELWNSSRLVNNEELEEIIKCKRRVIKESSTRLEEFVKRNNFSQIEGISEYYYRLDEYMLDFNVTNDKIDQLIKRVESASINEHQKIEFIEALSDHKKSLSLKINEFKQSLQDTTRFYDDYKKVLETIMSLQLKFRDFESIDNMELVNYRAEIERIIRLINQMHFEGDLMKDRVVQNESLQVELSRLLKRLEEHRIDLETSKMNYEHVLKQKTDHKKILEVKEHIEHEIDVLIAESERRREKILSRGFNQMHLEKDEFDYLVLDIDNCKQNVKKWKKSLEVVLQNSCSLLEKRELNDNLYEIDKKISSLCISVDNYQKSLIKTIQLDQECNQIEKWLSEKNIFLESVNLENDLSIVKTQIDELNENQRTKMKFISELCVELYKNPSPEITKHIVTKISNLLSNLIQLKNKIEIKSLKLNQSCDMYKPRFIAPDFLKKRLESVSVRENSSHVFECIASGSQPINVKWFKNGIELEPKHNCTFTFNSETQSCKLEIKNIHFNDTALYSCRITNSLGMAETSAYLRIQEEAKKTGIEPKIKIPLESTQIDHGQDYTLECMIVGDSDTRIIWLKDNIQITNLNSGYSIIQMGDLKRLIIKNAHHDRHSGSYTCKAQNDNGCAECSCLILVKESPIKYKRSEETSVKTHFTINNFKPILIKDLQNVMAREGDTIKFVCRIKSEPKCEAKWFLNNRLITKTDSQGEEYVLIVDKCKLEDAGDYRIEAFNHLGKIESHATLIVNSLEPHQLKVSSSKCQLSCELPLIDVLPIQESNKTKVNTDCL